MEEALRVGWTIGIANMLDVILPGSRIAGIEEEILLQGDVFLRNQVEVADRVGKGLRNGEERLHLALSFCQRHPGGTRGKRTKTRSKNGGILAASSGCVT